MVRVEIKEQDLLEIKVVGHANYAKHGYDIVCASVSTALIMTINLIEKMSLSYNIKQLVCEEGKFHLVIDCQEKPVNAIIENLIYTLKELENEYPKNIKISN